ncbi:MAG: hypothetical protein LBM25_06470 [Bacteroidales bacterium]|jgi:peptidoglycan/LPS O-acetylase OafA/YrhL|nr:hypothetical protein [Bacteroidales bacterium]
MSIGALGAYYLFNSKKKLSETFLYKKPLQIFIYTILFIYLLFNENINNVVWDFIFKTPIFSNLLIASIYLYIIVGISTAENSIIKIRNKTLSFLGEISYGIYMYHMLVIFLIVLLLKSVLLSLSPIISTILFYTLAIGITIFISYISKKYYEDFFIKKRYLRFLKKKK